MDQLPSAYNMAFDHLNNLKLYIKYLKNKQTLPLFSYYLK